MKKKSNWFYLAIAFICLVEPGQAQLVFATDQGLFERVNGQSVPIAEGLTPPQFPSLSRDGRFLTFSRPDLTSFNGPNPSSDLVVLDRATQTQRTIIDHNTAQIGADFDPLSSRVSPSGQFIVYGLRIGPANGTNLSSTTKIVVANFANGLEVSDPLDARNQQLGPTSDALSAEGRGISFFPGSDSFVTPVLKLLVAPGSAASDPGAVITRFDRDVNTGEWFAAAELSTAQIRGTSFAGNIPLDVEVTYQSYPAVSPSGTGLAYFDVFKPSRTSSLNPQPSVSRVILANSDGSDARILTSFNAGFLPTGLTWSTDGTALVVSISQQINLGTGFLDLPNTGNSAVFSVSTSDGTTNVISELPNGFAPTLPANGAVVNLSSVSPSLTRSSDGSLSFQASNLSPTAQFELQASSPGVLGDFSEIQQVTGTDLGNGVTIPFQSGTRFFRLVPASGN